MADIQSVTQSGFIRQFIRSTDFKWQRTPLQVCPLELISDYLKWPTPLLRANYHILIALKSGQFNQQVGIDGFDVEPGSVLFVPEREVFKINQLGAELSGFLILIEPKVLSSFGYKIELVELLNISSLTKADVRDFDWLMSLFDALHHDLTSDFPQRDIGSGLLQAVLHKLLALSSIQKSQSKQTELAIDFKQLVSDSFKQQKNVDFYAEKLNVSNNYLNRCVKSYFDKSCKQIILETCVLQSQLLLFETSMDISEIAYELGFEDASYFSRVFRNYSGVSPTEFKKSVMHGLS